MKGGNEEKSANVFFDFQTRLNACEIFHFHPSDQEDDVYGKGKVCFTQISEGWVCSEEPSARVVTRTLASRRFGCTNSATGPP